MSDGVAERLASVRERIAAAARSAGRDPGDVTLVGAAKRMDAETIAEAVAAGLAHVGENYVQEARDKIPRVAAALPGGVGPAWHLIGRLQRNKAREAVRLFAMVETVDRKSLARELARRAGAAGRRLPVLIQVNVSGEARKAGVAPGDLPALLDACRGLEALEVQGLMTVPEAEADPRPRFAELRRLRDSLAAEGELPHLSMGMSADFERAIQEGATIVRIGTAIFGPRRNSHAG